MQRKVGILTWHHYFNFGSMLQAYALQTAIEKLGCKSEIINYFDPAIESIPTAAGYAKYLVKKVMSACGLDSLLPYYYSFQRFFHDRLRKTRCVTSKEELNRMADAYSCIVFGSDQIWAPNVFDPVYMGDFVREQSVKRISYAASIGLNDIPQDLRPVYRQLLSGFARISVREEEGRQLLKTCCDLDAEVVVDPTLLLEGADYRKLEHPVKAVQEPYIFCYFLNKDHCYRQRVEDYARKTGLKVYGVSVCPEDEQWMQTLPAVGPEEFLWLIDHAQIVFTDSYHGTLFSLQFGKNFRTFERFMPDDPICQNSRIRQLDKMYGIGAWILSPEAQIDDTWEMDWDLFAQKLREARARSLEYLRKELQ